MKSITSLDTFPIYSFYRPHLRSTTWFTNEQVHPVTGEVSLIPSMTKQSFVAECDINNILKQFKATGQLSHVSAKAALGTYMDLPDQLDYQTALNVMLQGEAAFSSLPSSLRTRFDNDPAKFLEFMADPKNEDEIVKLGLATRTPEPPATAPAPKEPQAATPPSATPTA